MKKVMPPFSKAIANKSMQRDLVICTGPRAWEVAKSTWLCRSPKLVLPADRDPSDFIWPVMDRSVIIRECGGTENPNRLLNLIREVLEAGAVYALVIYQNLKMIRFEPDIEEIESEG